MRNLRSLTLVLLLLLISRAGAATLEITVDEPTGVARTAWPVTSGVPLAAGALRDPQAAALVRSDGRQVPLQTEVLARWPDGSIRWLLLDFQVDLGPRETKTFSLRYSEEVERTTVQNPLLLERNAGAVVIDTGPLRLEIPARGPIPLGNVWLDRDGNGKFAAEELLTGTRHCSVVLTDSSGTFSENRTPGVPESAVEPDKITVEQSGPMRACVRIEGRHVRDDQHMFRYVVRLHAYRGQPFMKLSYTFVNDHQESLMAKIDTLGLHFSLPDAAVQAKHALFDGRPVAVEPRRLLQVDENHYRIGNQRAGDRAAGWAAIGTDAAGFAVGLREFWQNWPKSIELTPGDGSRPAAIDIGICPAVPPGLYQGKPLEEENKLYYQLRDDDHTLKIGVARTHELWATFFAGAPDVGNLSQFFAAAEDPLLATCPPAHVSSTRAAGEFPPADPTKYAGYDAWLDRALEAHLERRGQAREYGMLNYGDWYGERRVNWGNLEYDLAHGLFLQYLRSGDRRFFLRAEQAARHHIDVDVVHATNAHLENPWGPAPKVGEIWLHCLNHTGGYYADAPLPVSRTYQMGHSTNFGHVWVSGDLDYYYLTGDRRAWDVSIQIADAMAAHCPTSYGTHIRGLGWPMILVLQAYDATGDQKYLDAARANWQVLKENIDWSQGWVIRLASGHCLHPERTCHGNVPFMEGLTLCALTRYHRITGDPDVLRAISVGIDQMIRECWQEDVKTFRYTACPLSSKAPYSLFLLSAEAMAYEIALTANPEHRRILREGLRAAIPNDSGRSAGKSLAQMIHFTPHGLRALDEPVGQGSP